MKHLLFLFFPLVSFSQPRILHYTETSGFDHNTRQQSHQMFLQLSSELNLVVDDDSTGDAFATLANLMQYDVVVFSNTTGDALLNFQQQAHFEDYIAAGKHVIGIHSATDTYRHSTSNGTNTGVWDFYAELIGASCRQNPTHVTGIPVYTMFHQQPHFLLSDIPSPWIKAEEYYYWEDGYFDTLNNNVLLKVEETIGPNGLVNSYDSTRATTWIRNETSGSRIYYTSLGHDAVNFTSDTAFYKLIRNALIWTIGLTPINDITENLQLNFENPVIDDLEIKCNENAIIRIYDYSGKQVLQEFNCKQNLNISTAHWRRGVYILQYTAGNKAFYRKIVKM